MDAPFCARQPLFVWEHPRAEEVEVVVQRNLVIALYMLSSATVYAQDATPEAPNENAATTEGAASDARDEANASDDGTADPSEGETEAETAPAAATEAPPAAATTMARIVSGGVSLGAYQAGVLYVEGEWFKGDPTLHVPLATGASAGSANSLLSAISSCLPRNDDPTQDLGYQTWMDLGYNDLFDRDAVEATHVFTRAPLARSIDRIETIWRDGLPEDCDLLVGMSATRLRATSTDLHSSLDIPRMNEGFTFRIKGRGEGRPPLIENIVLTDTAFPHPLLPFSSEETEEAITNNVGLIGKLVFASAAFPGAFAPVELPYCLSDPDAATATSECAEATHRAMFVDGGVLDNNPLNLATRIAEHENLGPIGYSYLDPDATAFPFVHGVADDETPGFFGMLTGLLGEFVSTARAQELARVAESDPDLIRQLYVLQRNFPTVSEQLSAFLGFFEEEFRRFDFYLGMYDAFSSLRTTYHALPPEVLFSLLTALHPTVMTNDPAQVDEHWKPFVCLVGALEEDAAHWLPACEDPALRDFAILTQVTLDRLYAMCRDIDDPGSHKHCQRSARGEAPPRIVPSVDEEVDTGTRLENEEDLDHTLRLLGEYGFHFEDLGLDRDESEYGRVKLRRAILAMTSAMADAQTESSSGFLLKTGGRYLANSIQYEPPRNWMYVSVGNNVEFGASVLPWNWLRSWLRLNFALRINGLSSLLDFGTASVNFTLAAGPEFQILPLSSPVIQPVIGIRGGYRFASR